MASNTNQPASSEQSRSFLIDGQIQREQADPQDGEMKLTAYVFDRVGTLLGSAALDEKGFYMVAVALAQPAAVDLIVGPADMPQKIRSSSAYRKSFAAADWQAEGTQFHLKYDTLLPVEIWRSWWPVRICVSGHVRKVSQHDGVTEICPVPYVKVEIFDVDRESCLWPYYRKWWEYLLDRPVIRIPDLMREPRFPPKPFPGPDPVPDVILGMVPNLQSEPGPSSLERAGHGPQLELLNTVTQQPAFSRVGEARLMDGNLASRLDKLTVTSRIAPWFVFPYCFYSKEEVGETTTDCSGDFNCCFTWWPFHFRHGRLRLDARPDIIIKVTQVINGVPTVIYMDPYTSTRWNGNNAHIDLFLDNEEVICGSGCYDPLPGSPVFFTRIGDDEVYKINQTTVG